MIRRFHAEMATGVATAAIGLVAVVGAVELGHRWEESGPQSGYFPFYVGTILIAASLWNLGRAYVRHREALAHSQATGEIEEPFLAREPLHRIGRFLAALLAFVVLTVSLGIYVGSTLYIAWSAWRQGGYRLTSAVGIGLLFAVSLYLVFEVAFRVPLLKGPIEPLLGIY
jgi:hypothetical protein